jgi:hypothetical protein
MDKMLVAVFESEAQAAAAAGAMKDQCAAGVLLIYACAVFVKDLGKISVVHCAGDQDHADPALAMATQSLVELLAEPFCSGDVGHSEVPPGGATRMANAGVDAVFLGEVARHLSTGRSAVVSEIEEEIATAMDTLLEAYGGTGFRCARRETLEAQIAAELELRRSEIRTLENQLLTAAESKASLQANLDLARSRLQAAKDRARCRAASITREAEAKIVLLQQRAATAERDTKAMLERLANQIRVEYVNRATSLNLAWKLGADAAMVFLVVLFG